MIYDLRFTIYELLPGECKDAESTEVRRVFEVRREAKRHAAFEFGVPRVVRKRCRRCALPPQSKRRGS